MLQTEPTEFDEERKLDFAVAFPKIRERKKTGVLSVHLHTFINTVSKTH
jgi:hypothetical protein